ncbi:thiamine-phosphate kinase [Aquibacillus koreensis]|uniref:Thiamine-monophosphate kinase n=2 Tax=Aquibacillus koreensis TaxID=279446 RepID=A0A9X4AIV6_9BACI|nr:thiamine-phosphate kinase [Aquibacillus koreensis]MCT2536692.1 thiamine-phosphate kinase [Aquibacillus koreensis]MDC3421552.1 thiamine-phosphate kinase [Aquibacillus koreensis]
MDEFDFIKSIQQKNYKQPSLIKGVGDDAAVFRSTYQDTVTSVDTFVENVHFSIETMKPYHIGYRALAANISDMAAMGCNPAYYLVSIVIPKHWSEQQLADIFEGMKDLASVHNMDLLGGDTVSGNELVLSITVIGFVDKDKARYRSNAVSGDRIFVTGTLGDSAAGLHVLLELDEKDQEPFSYFINRHRMPTPRVSFAKRLQSLSRVALNDISDGIANEAAEIAEASKVMMHINYEQIPSHHQLDQFDYDKTKEWKLSGGEDFELIGTVSEKEWPLVVKIGEETNTKVTAIGYVSELTNIAHNVMLYENNNKQVLHKSGYTHLK